MNPARHSSIRTALWFAMLLVGWGMIKVQWESALQHRQEQLRYHGLTLDRSLTEKLGQDATLAALAGLRAVVANLFWIQMEGAWERREWFKVKSDVELATTLQPRSVVFWDGGAHQFAWNAAIDRRNNPDEPSLLLRLRDEKYWVDQGVALLDRGISNNPEKMDLWYLRGWIKEERRHDYLGAARDFEEALRRPHPPQYLERFVGYDLEKGGDLPAAYAWWKKLWFSTTDRSQKFRAWDIVEKHLRDLEQRLSIPAEKRVFPEAAIRDSQPR